MATRAAGGESYAEINIWRARDKEGYVTTSSDGARGERKREALARVGHASMSVVDNSKSTYMSLWPNFKEIPGQRGMLVESLDVDNGYEGSAPDVIVRLYELRISIMKIAFHTVRGRVEKGELGWTWNASDQDDVTHRECREASCVSFVWSILKKGGVNLFQTPNKKKWSKTGPKDQTFYKTLKLHFGQTAGGVFDGAPWTSSYFTPYALNLRVGSLAEKNWQSKLETIKIMQSDRVVETRERQKKGKMGLIAAAQPKSGLLKASPTAADSAVIEAPATMEHKSGAAKGKESVGVKKQAAKLEASSAQSKVHAAPAAASAASTQVTSAEGSSWRTSAHVAAGIGVALILMYAMKK